jgi:glycosyltransferase involved in cell wall biosynthesis
MLSVIIPTYNEEENVKLLYKQLKNVLDTLKNTYEIIFIDDGSIDKTFSILKELAKRDKKLKIIRLKRNYGQSAALAAGFNHAKGEVIITMDADLQNHPSDIPKLIKKLNKADIVCGWRKRRKDALISKRIPSLISNWIARRLTKVNIHDFGCTLRAYKKNVIEDLDIYGELHRYIPALAKMTGHSVVEVEVKHSARKHGKTKYKISRLFKGMSDLLTLTFLERFGTRPAHAFNSLGLMSFGVGGLILLILIVDSLINWGTSIVRPALYLSIILILGGIQFITLGLMSEMITRLRYDLEDKKFYKIKEIIN